MPTIYHYYRDFHPDARPLNGGMEKAISGLAGGLIEASRDTTNPIHCTILCEGAGNAIYDHLLGFRIQQFDDSATRSKRFGLAPELASFIKTKIVKGDLVILHAIFHTGVNAMSRALFAAKVPFIVAPHDPYHPSIFAGKRLMKEIYWRLFERPMLRRAAAVQVLDQRHEKYLRERGVTTPVIEVVNGFARDEVPDAATLRPPSTSGPMKLLFLGRIDRQNKGLDLLIDAFALIAKKYPDATLTLQGPDRGDGPALNEQIARLRLDGRVKILPPDFETRPSELTARFDLFLLPSRFEGFGLSALEAMLAARPVIVSDVAGLAPHVRECDGGAVIDATVESIHAGLEEMIARRSEWIEIGMRGRVYVLDKLDWKTIARDAIPKYLKLLG